MDRKATDKKKGCKLCYAKQTWLTNMGYNLITWVTTSFRNSFSDQQKNSSI